MVESAWRDVRRLLWDDDDLILIVNDVRQTKPMKLASKVTVQPRHQYCCGNSFRLGSTRRKDNVIGFHTWVIEFDDMPIEEQRRFWDEHSLPHTLRVFSGNKSIHVYIRTEKSVGRERWLAIANDLKRIFLQADHRVLTDSARLSRLPGGMRVDVTQTIETTNARIPLKTLIEWIEKQRVIEVYRRRDIEKNILREAQTFSLSVPERIHLVNQAEDEYRERHPDRFALYDRLVIRRIRPVRGQRNQALIELVTFLHDSVCKDLAREYAELFYNLNLVLFNDPLNQHMFEAESHWNGMEALYPDRLSETEREFYAAIKDEQQPFWRICRSFAYGDDSPAGSFSFKIPMTHFGLRLGLDGQQVFRMIGKFIDFGILECVERGTQHRQNKDGTPQRGTAGLYRWLLSSSSEVL